MPRPPTVWRTNGFAGTRTTVRAYLYDELTGAAILPEAITQIRYWVYQAIGPDPGDQTGGAILSPPANYVFSTLSTVGWTTDARGWNFRATLPPDAFPDAGDYVILIQFALSDGSSFPLRAYHHAEAR